MKKIILIKYGEIGLKGKNRHFFESMLMENIRIATGVGARDLKHYYGRIYLRLTDEQQLIACERALKQVFGVVGFAQAFELPLTDNIDSLKPLIIELLQQQATAQTATFSIDTRRIEKNFPLESPAVNCALGGVVLENFPHWKVNIKQPDIRVCVEIRAEGMFVYLDHQSTKGPGGLPVGVSGKGLLLLSGGIDSPVAGWSLMKRGMLIDAIYFHSFPYTGDKAKEKVLDLAKILTQWKQRAIQVCIPYFTKIQETINQNCPQDSWTILHRRMMLRVAEKIAHGASPDGHYYHALITGDNLGQVASQTIQNIAVVSQATHLPILRPLISFDKQDIVTLARQIGSYTISNRPFADCCTLFAPKNPQTKAVAAEIIAAEQKLDIDALVNEALAKMEIVKIQYPNSLALRRSPQTQLCEN
jgi:thiamine biosynthesis protein ThiI